MFVFVREIAFSEPFKIHLPLAQGASQWHNPSVEATSQFFKLYKILMENCNPKECSTGFFCSTE